jgi:integrase
MGQIKAEKAKARYGSGMLYLQPGCDIWYMQIRFNGKRVRKSTGETDKRAANQFLTLELGKLAKGEYVAPDKSRTRVADLFTLVERDYMLKKRKTLEHEQQRWKKNLQPVFGDMLARNVHDEHITAYIDARVKAGASHATVNRETALLKRAFKLGRIRTVTFEHLTEDNARTGFIGDKEFSILTAVPLELWFRTFLEMSYAYGWRKAELLNLQVIKIDLDARVIRLEPGTTKNREGREVTMTKVIHALLTECVTGKATTDYVLTRNGERIKDFRRAWHNLCVQVGLAHWECRTCGKTVKGRTCCGSKPKYVGLYGHDFRRSMAREQRKRGTAESVIMKIGGWKTPAVFKRYDIVNNKDTHDAITSREESQEIGHNFGHNRAEIDGSASKAKGRTIV